MGIMLQLNLFTVIASLGLIFGLISFIIACYALIRIIATEKSTHSVHFASPEQTENWAMDDKDVESLNKRNKDDIDFDFKNLGI